MKENLSVLIIPTWNKRQLVIECVEILQSFHLPVDVIIVDNGSQDGTLSAINSLNLPNLRCIRNDTNLGFAEGVNVGIKAALEKSYANMILLNNDTIVQPGWFEALLSASATFPIVGSTLLDKQGLRIDTIGEQFSSWGLFFSVGRGFPAASFARPDSVFAVCGGAMLIKREVFESIGLFDKDFFAYFEDIDFCYRARHAGFEIAVSPTALVHHAQGATASQFRGFPAKQTMQNLPLVHLKNTPRWLLWRILPRLTFAYLLFLGAAIRRGQGRPALSGLLSFLRLAPSKFAQRNQTLRASRLQRERLKSLIVWDLPPTSTALRKVRYYLTLGRSAK
jgi:GT2 family glycosyltransferase